MKKEIISVVASVLATLIVLKIGIFGVAMIIFVLCVIYGLDKLDLLLGIQAKIKDASAWKRVHDRYEEQLRELKEKTNEDYRSIIDGSYYKKTTQDKTSQDLK